MLRMEIFLSVSLISVGTFGHDPGWNLAGVGPQFFVSLDQSLGSVGVVPSLSTTTVDVGAEGVRGRCVCTSPCVWCRLSVAHIAGDGLSAFRQGAEKRASLNEEQKNHLLVHCLWGLVVKAGVSVLVSQHRDLDPGSPTSLSLT